MSTLRPNPWNIASTSASTDESTMNPEVPPGDPDAVVTMVPEGEDFRGFKVFEHTAKPVRGRGRGRPRGSRGTTRGSGRRRTPPRVRGYLRDNHEDEDYEEEEDEEEEKGEGADGARSQLPDGFQPFLQLVGQLLAAKNPQAVRVPEYDGTLCYTMFRAQFVVLTSGMSKEEQGARLLGALRGKAMMVLPMLDQQQKEANFDNLDAILTKTFSSVKSLWERKREFETLQQKPDQKIQEFAQEVERVGREYMVTHAEPDLQEALVTAFVKGLTDKDAANRLAYAPCNTLEEAVRHLNRGLLLSVDKSKKVRFVEAAVNNTETEQTPSVSETDVNTQLAEIMNKLKALTSNSVSVNSFEEAPGTSNSIPTGRGRGRGRGRPRGSRGGRGRGNQNSQGTNTFACHNCGKPGHYAADCYFRQQGNNNAQTCHYCKRPGHIKAECRKRLRDEQQGSHPYNSVGFAMPQFPQDALRAAMAYYQFQNGQQQSQLTNQPQQQQQSSNGSSQSFPYVPQSGNQGN